MPETAIASEGTILYVDDTEAQRYAVSRVLRRAGFEVREAASGSQALQMSALGPDLVVLDVKLPDINGFEVCKRIKENPVTAHTPVLQVSATWVSTQARVAGLEGGADAYLVQPVDPEELVATIRALLRIRRAEEQARKQAREIEAIYSSAPVGLAMLDRDLRFTRVNQLLAEINGLPPEQHIGKSVREMFPGGYTSVAPYYDHILSTGEPILNVELRIPAPTSPGIMRDWLINMHPLKDDQGTVLGINVVVQEITERKRAEEETRKTKEIFQAFMENLPFNAYMKDAEGKYVFHNKAAKRTFPYLNHSFGKSDVDLFTPEVAEQFRRNDAAVLDSGKAQEFPETTVESGLTRHWLSVKFPFFDSSGQRLLAGVSLDLTEKKQLEELTLRQEIQRQLLEREILARESERERLARELHDESGQMLTSVLAGLRLVEDAKTIKQAKERAHALRELASRTIGDMGRLSRGLHPIVLDDLGLVVALRNYVSEYSDLHGLRVHIRIVGMGPDRVSRNIERGVYRIAQEALTNVVRHAHATTLRIIVLRNHDTLAMRIRDNGSGFTQQSHKAGSKGHLGLQGMHERAAIIGGHLTVESQPASGTCITVMVPVEARDSLEIAEQVAPAC
jgi:PAS domain S-box-containing protein